MKINLYSLNKFILIIYRDYIYATSPQNCVIYSSINLRMSFLRKMSELHKACDEFQ